jgi:hypothetical protein
MPRKEEAYLNIISIIIIVLAASVLTLREFTNFSIAQAQGNNITTSSLTPEQKAAMCDPDNPLSKLKSVNTTESHICGIPKTQSSNTTSSEMMTTGAGAPSETPSETPPPQSMPPSIPPFPPTG